MQELRELSFYTFVAARYFGVPLLFSAVSLSILTSLLFRSFRLLLLNAAVVSAMCAGVCLSAYQPTSQPHFPPYNAPAVQTALGFLV